MHAVLLSATSVVFATFAGRQLDRIQRRPTVPTGADGERSAAGGLLPYNTNTVMLLRWGRRGSDISPGVRGSRQALRVDPEPALPGWLGLGEERRFGSYRQASVDKAAPPTDSVGGATKRRFRRGYMQLTLPSAAMEQFCPVAEETCGSD